MRERREIHDHACGREEKVWTGAAVPRPRSCVPEKENGLLTGKGIGGTSRREARTVETDRGHGHPEKSRTAINMSISFSITKAR